MEGRIEDKVEMRNKEGVGNGEEVERKGRKKWTGEIVRELKEGRGGKIEEKVDIKRRDIEGVKKGRN